LDTVLGQTLYGKVLLEALLTINMESLLKGLFGNLIAASLRQIWHHQTDYFCYYLTRFFGAAASQYLLEFTEFFQPYKNR
jgi:hypothetical protein